MKQKLYRESVLRNTETYCKAFEKINEQYMFLMGSSHISNTQIFHMYYFYYIHCLKTKSKMNTCM